MTDPAAAPAASPSAESSPWWRSAVIYQVYPRSFADADGDGVGDLPGITARLDHLRDLGVDAVWVSPFYPSPQADAGYDVADYCDVDPLFGTLADAERLIDAAHQRGLKVIIDVVPNHTSDRHPWFQRALAAAPGDEVRDWYHFRSPDPDDPEAPPNDWPSEFGGSAWSKTPDGQWYLHLFDSSQPDLNWEHPPVREAFRDILRFWLDRGVDGFRIDVAHGLVKAPGLPDSGLTREELATSALPTHTAPYFDQDGVHEIYRDWRGILEGYPGERLMVAEAWIRPYDRIARYVRPDEHHQAFNFGFLGTAWDAQELREHITRSYAANDPVGAPTTWVLSNHDVVRHATRFGWPAESLVTQLDGTMPEPVRETGLRRARAATTLMLALPGSAYLFQGEELGLFEVLDLDPSVRQDPTFHRTDGDRLGRDGCRVPLPWEAEEPAFGFSPTGEAWLPQPDGFQELAVDQQAGVAGSTLELYRALLAVRRERGLGTGEMRFVDEPVVEATVDSQSVVAFDVTTPAGTTRVLLNLGPALPLPEDATVLVASGPLQDGTLPTDTAVWLAV
ncbi:glycoside hydrolase family 13 protein [Brevibacterium senegalense]|uniref:glycoside hydrolase family 13 protein n=1 Tax=Brevibacterium senegalense TaxID=1033736 RepID=UPI0002D34BA9|nr:alpha-amylase family glycosyl hydrolase [Brevibacterium senegalense]